MSILRSNSFSVSISIAGLPSWVGAIGESVALANGTLGASVRAAGGNSYGGTDPDDISEPWSGGALVTISGAPYLVCMGGGHGDSGYNGLHKFGPINSETPSWSVFLSPSATGAQQNGATYTDGRQSSVHTYNNIIGVGDTVYSTATDGYYSVGNASDSCFKFTESGQTALSSNSLRAGLYGACAHYSGVIGYIGGNFSFDDLRLYTIATDSWASRPGADLNHFFQNYVSLAADSNRGAWLAVNGSKACYWDASYTRTTGINAPTGYENCMVFDPDRDKFVCWGGGLTMYELDAASLAAGGSPSWTTRTFTGTTPSTSYSQGTFGRFQYIESMGCYILVPQLESDVYVLRSA